MTIVEKYCRKFLASLRKWQCDVSDQIQNKRSDQMFKSEFKNDKTIYR